MKLKADFSGLTDAQIEQYGKINALFGLGPDECTYQFSAENGNPQPLHLVLSSHPEKSDVPPYFVPVGSIAEMRKLAGYDDILPKPAYREEDERHYPAPLSSYEENLLNSAKGSAKPEISEDLKKRIDMAAVAYVMLDPDRVLSYVPLINATRFPGRVAYFASGPLNIPPNGSITLTGPDGAVFNYTTVTVGAGGTINIDIHCTFNCQSFTQL
jgi:hypothetical protein